MKFNNGQMIKGFTVMDNIILEKISRIEDLSKLSKDVMISLCRQIFRQDENNVIHTSGWGAADITAGSIGCSERGVRRAYKELAERNMISKRLRMREEDINGRAIPREVNWITINTDTTTWKVKEWRYKKSCRDNNGSCRDKSCRGRTP